MYLSQHHNSLVEWTQQQVPYGYSEAGISAHPFTYISVYVKHATVAATSYVSKEMSILRREIESSS